MFRGFEENEDFKVYEEKCSEVCIVYIYVFIDKRFVKLIFIDKRF